MSWIIKSSINDYNIEIVNNIDSILSLYKDHTILIDSKIVECWPQLYKNNCIIIEANEQSKSIENIAQIFTQIISNKTKPKTHFIGIGGGVIQDITGFIASIWSRGSKYTLVPTTLLAQVDSCIGGKTSINADSIKNILGTFWPPSSIMIYTNILSTLSDSDYWSGFGEWIKYNIIDSGNPGFDKLILDRSIDPTSKITWGLSFKQKFIEIDEFDKKERKFLNFGHTFGHAIESLSRWEISHGYAVFLGCIIASKVSSMIFKESIKYNYESLLQSLVGQGKEYLMVGNVKLKKEYMNPDSLYQIAKIGDKKQDSCSDGLNMVLLGIDGPCVQHIDNINIIKEAIHWVSNEICV